MLRHTRHGAVRRLTIVAAAPSRGLFKVYTLHGEKQAGYKAGSHPAGAESPDVHGPAW